jgi:hypothetical protein
MLGSLGMIGFLAAAYLWIQPIIHCLKKFQDLDLQTKLTILVFIALSAHSMVDIVMSRWPTMYVALILQGLLWSESFTSTRQTADSSTTTSTSSDKIKFSIPQPLHAAAVAASFLFAVFFSYRDAIGSAAERRAVMAYEYGCFAVAAQEYDKAAQSTSNPIFAYQAGIFSIIYLRDYFLSLKYFTFLQSLPATIPVHSNAHIAECLIHSNRKRDALDFLEKELRVYPISIIAIYNKMRLEIDLGLAERAKATNERLEWALKFKGLKRKDLACILKNPELDGRFHLIKKSRIRENSATP